MDPASAGVAFVGFAASITTLTAVVLDSSKTLYNLRKKLQTTPEDVKRLVRQVKVLEALLQAVEHALQDNGNPGISRELQELWECLADEMRIDMERFKVVVSRLRRLLDGPTVSSRLIRLRVRQIFDEDTVKAFQGQISSHIESLTLIQTIINDRKLHMVSQHVTKLADVSSSLFQTVYAKLQSTESSSHGRHRRQQESLSQIDNRLQLLQRQLELGPLRASGSFVERAGAGQGKIPSLKTTVAATIYWSSRTYTLAIGTLHVQVIKKRKYSVSAEAAAHELEESGIKLTFVPPRWLSSIILRCDLEIGHNMKGGFSSLMVNIIPVSINNNPLLYQAIEQADVAGLRYLFEAGLARPTDQIPDGSHLVSLLDYFRAHFRYGLGYKCYDMYQFLIENRGPATLHTMPQLCHTLKIMRPDGKDKAWRAYLDAFLAHGGEVLTESDTTDLTGLSILVSSRAGFDCIQDCLLRQVEPWTMEDLAYADAWLIGVLVHTNQVFRRVIKKYIDSYRSTFYTMGRLASNDRFESVFGIQTIVTQVKTAPEAARVRFLKTISYSGTHTMLRPFLDSGVDVDEGRLLHNYLGNAAANGQLATFHMLLDAGANAALALPACLVLVDHSLSSTFQHLSSLLFKKTVFNGGPFEHGELHDSFFFEYCMVAIIMCNQHEMLEFLLRNGAEANLQMRYLFRCCSPNWEMTKPCTWLILAVECGSATCADILVRYRAKIAYPDGSGRTAFQLAQANTAGVHPRKFNFSTDQGLSIARYVAAAEDVKTLALLERAWEAQSKRPAPIAMVSDDEILGSGIRATYRGTDKPPDSQVQAHSGSVASYSNYTQGSFLVSLGRVRRFLHVIITCTRAEYLRSFLEGVRHDLHQLSHLSFWEALLMRLGYVVSYCLLLFYEVTAIAIWMGRLPRPPRAIISGVGLVTLAVMWGFYV